MEGESFISCLYCYVLIVILCIINPKYDSSVSDFVWAKRAKMEQYFKYWLFFYVKHCGVALNLVLCGWFI